MVERPRGTDSARVMQVIETKSIIGAGTKEDPYRPITQYWDFEGNLLAASILMKENSETA